MDNNTLKHIGEMATLSEVVNALTARGYTIDFNLRNTQSGSGRKRVEEFPQDFFIDKIYRFEGESDPDDEAILYAISSLDGKVRGIFVDGYGTSSQDDWFKVIGPLKKKSQ
jgi:hypothetical protein